ncbi:MAG: FTR1 family protein [Candidatus Omnitrophica bacterium]|nr:FTR1 family protein [Candidatus Omnitrophota bacterium]
MLSIAIVIFREVLEIALIVGVLLAATRGLPKRTPWVWMGLLAGLAGACVIAVFADVISAAFEGMGQEVMNAIILFTAAFLIAWTVLWMSRHGRHLTQHFKHVGEQVKSKREPMYTLATVVGLAVLREGAEIVMFIYSALVTGGKIYQLTIGALLGMCAGASVGMAIYYGLMKIPMKKIFTVTNWLLIFLVAGMVASGFGYLAAAGKVPELVTTVWDTSWLVSENSILGKVMHVMGGYSERPSGIQLLTFLSTIAGLAVALKFYGRPPSHHSKKIATIIAAALVSVAAGHWPEARADDVKVYSPLVVQGEREFEIQGSYGFDNRASKNNARQEKYLLGYGVTDRWATELGGRVEQSPDEDGAMSKPKFKNLAWENRYQLTEQGQYWLDAGLYLEYEQSFVHDQPDALEGKILLEKTMARFVHTANLITEKETRAYDGKTKTTEARVAWSSKYLWKRYLQPGFEYHADFGEVRLHNPYKQQGHQIGPNLYGKIGRHLRYDIGYLFGISPASPDGKLKWVMEYEF